MNPTQPIKPASPGFKPALCLLAVWAVIMLLAWLIPADLPFNRKIPVAPVWICMLTTALMLLLLLLIYGRRSVVLAQGRLEVKSVLNKISVPTAQISRAVRIGEDEAPVPTSRTNGTAMPGLKSGWFQAGGRKVFIDYVRSPNVWIQTEGAADILLELEQPEALLRLLEAA